MYIHQTHTVLNTAVKWKWIGTNPAEQPAPDPQPPSSTSVALLRVAGEITGSTGRRAVWAATAKSRVQFSGIGASFTTSSRARWLLG